MSHLIKSEIETIIKNFYFSNGSILSERVSEIIIKNNAIGFSVDITGISLEEAKDLRELLKKDIEAKISNNADDYKVNIILTSASNETVKKEQKFIKLDGNNHSTKIILDDVKKIILIASGKGGVGKSTISSLIAQKLASQQKKVGLLDADIYGPSIPDIFGINKKPEVINNRMIPIEKYNVKLNSIGFIADPKSSISWRGPMVSKALYQLFSLTNWGTLDYLIIDTPPGTGDIHLSLLQNYHLSGVIMVTTPQKIAAIDVQRAIDLYRKFNVPIVGIIENMSYYHSRNLPNNSKTNVTEKISLFSGNSGKLLAENNNIPWITNLPLVPELAECCDQGMILEKQFSLLDFDGLFPRD